jgi:hypothetical protein
MRLFCLIEISFFVTDNVNDKQVESAPSSPYIGVAGNRSNNHIYFTQNALSLKHSVS